ncbi:6-phosphogluconolactonase [Carnobacterium alterfunditum]|uniref:6-phosphogluconolactonase n=1 Tax=Carnobacterium alterfunditum TaxID=28230 RepID=A0A1N6HT82_9LACT|nr:lactonase family protein [Carnobacterium alterfunditum]SIO22971.1 6-phosphogluconolactonase [Carnobacterium alterfunditum]
MKETMYLGTYTRGNSEGIYEIVLDTKTKRLEEAKLVAKIGNPTYLALSNGKDILYAVSKTESGGGLAAFKKKPATTYKNTTTFFEKTSELIVENAAPPCYVAYDADRSLVYTTSYHDGFVSVYKTDSKGNLTLTDVKQHVGSSVHENQTKPHAHYLDLTPDRHYVVACDLGTDTIYTYKVSEDGKLDLAVTYKASPGTGPRHLVFHPNGKFAYLVGELSSEIIVLAYNAAEGSFETVQAVSSIPEGHTAFNSGSAVRITEDGKFLYSSNRGHNSIAVYAINESGNSLERIQLIASEGNTPRDFALDPTEQFIIVGHQDSDKLTLFERDAETGLLSLLQKDVYAPECVCVTF